MSAKYIVTMTEFYTLIPEEVGENEVGLELPESLLAKVALMENLMREIAEECEPFREQSKECEDENYRKYLAE